MVAEPTCAAAWGFRVMWILILSMIAFSANAERTTTIITHGAALLESSIEWTEGMARAIVERAGGGSVYRYVPANGKWMYLDEHGDGSKGTVVLLFDWIDESSGVVTGANWDYTDAAGEALVAALRDPRYLGSRGPRELLAGRVVHFIGHSRGTCVNSDAARRLAAEDPPIAVDQITTLDPHPVNGTLDGFGSDWGDDVPRKWRNVAWADNIWREDNDPLDLNGMALAGAKNIRLRDENMPEGYPSGHADVHLWYHGTIDVDQDHNVWDGAEHGTGERIRPGMRGEWYAQHDDESSGYVWSRIGGGAEDRSNQAQGANPGDVAIPCNGSFVIGSLAGWSFHGGGWRGSGDDLIEDQAGDHFVQLGVVEGGGVNRWIRHNRFFVPPEMEGLSLRYQIVQRDEGDENDVLYVEIEPVGEARVRIAERNLFGSASGGGWKELEVILPEEVRGRSCTVRIGVDGNGRIEAAVRVDEVRAR